MEEILSRSERRQWEDVFTLSRVKATTISARGATVASSDHCADHESNCLISYRNRRRGCESGPLMPNRPVNRCASSFGLPPLRRSANPHYETTRSSRATARMQGGIAPWDRAARFSPFARSWPSASRSFFHETLFGGKVLSPADVLLVSASFREPGAGDYEPANRLLMDPVLQFQPWLEFNRTMIRSGRLPLWNGYAGCGTPHLANGQSAVFDPFHLLAYLGTTPQAYAWIAAGRLWMAGLGMFLLARSWGLGFWGRWFAGLVYPFCGFLVVWLLFPGDGRRDLDAVAVPGDRPVVSRTRGQGAAWLAIVVALVIFGGHIQTSAHVLLAGGLYALARGFWARADGAGWRRALLYVDAGDLPGPGIVGRPDSAAGFLSGEEPGLERPPDRTAGVVGDRSAPAARRGLHGGPLCLWKPAPGSSQSGASPGRPQLE